MVMHRNFATKKHSGNNNKNVSEQGSLLITFYWNIIVCGDHPAIKNGKPYPDIYIYIETARQLNLLQQNCLVIEDALS
jgi:beta-phosphoglucomutase-like phosphatase (HAD superfamily)